MEGVTQGIRDNMNSGTHIKLPPVDGSHQPQQMTGQTIKHGDMSKNTEKG